MAGMLWSLLDALSFVTDIGILGLATREQRHEIGVG